MCQPEPGSALERLVRHVLSTPHAAIPEAARARMRTFLLDSLGVGVAGSAGAHVPELLREAQSWGSGDEATAWVWGTKLPARAAAFLNSYQMHCLEFDCVHERAVLHPVTVVMPTALAYAERRAAQGNPVSGADFLDACIIGVDVAVLFGVAATGPMRFFRPATCGGFGAVAALGRLEGFDAAAMASAFGLQYGQTSGTLQPHDEGSPLLGLQVGFAARAALDSCAFARAGIQGPLDILTGRYGYFPLFENGVFDLEAALGVLGKPHFIEQVSHKPFPTGRLTHATLTGLIELLNAGLDPARIATFSCHIPPLPARLVGRPDVPEPPSNYAKLCLPFVLGTYMNHRAAELRHFRETAFLHDKRTHDFAGRVEIIVDGNPDQNAMGPVRVCATLDDGTQREAFIPVGLGHYDAPLTEAQNQAKFRQCWDEAARPMSPDGAAGLIAACAAIDTADNAAAALAPWMVAP